MRPLVGVVSLFLLVLAATWIITGQRLSAEKDMASRNAQSHQESLALIISEHLTQVLDRGVLFALASAEWFDGNSNDAKNRLAAMLSADHTFQRIALYDLQSNRVYASSPSTDSEQLGEAVQLAIKNVSTYDESRMHVGPQAGSMVQVWQVPLLYPVVDRTGRTRGLCLIILDLGFLLGQYRDIEIGRTGAIQILSRPGSEIVRVRQGGLELSTKQWHTERLPFSGLQHGSLVTNLFEDKHDYQTSFKHLERYPFLVVVSRDLAEMQADYGINGSRFPPILWMLTAILLGATVWVGLVIQKQERLVRALEAADADKHKLILQLEGETLRAIELASHDHLTSLPNRRMFYELGASHIARAKRSRLHYGLLYIDLDRFKSINDTLGHHVGDLLLQTVSSRLTSVLRESDVVARLGGDEFAVLLGEVDGAHGISVIAQKIVETVGRPCINLDGHDIQVSPSIGIAVFPRDGHNIETLARHADAAMYKSKRAGRGRFTFYEPSLNPVSARQFELEQRLPHAIACDELVLYFQPKVRLSDFRIVGFEALVRWNHPEHGLIQPGEFIPMAESTGMDVALGDWVAKAACRQLALWREDGLDTLPIAINVTARQLHDEDLSERIAEYLSEFKLPAHLLQVEITEGSLVGDIEIASSVLQDLENIGVRIALDDFGNGYSSFNYIRTLPIHVIKIDRSFVEGIRNSPADAVIVASIVTLAHNLNKRVIAEGVELMEQLMHLKTVGCDEVQGYLLNRPMPVEAVRQILIQPTWYPDEQTV